jgi:hypothetical protein
MMERITVFIYTYIILKRISNVHKIVQILKQNIDEKNYYNHKIVPPVISNFEQCMYVHYVPTEFLFSFLLQSLFFTWTFYMYTKDFHLQDGGRWNWNWTNWENSRIAPSTLGYRIIRIRAILLPAHAHRRRYDGKLSHQCEIYFLRNSYSLRTHTKYYIWIGFEEQSI